MIYIAKTGWLCNQTDLLFTCNNNLTGSLHELGVLS